MSGLTDTPIKQFMTTTLFTLKPEDTMSDAYQKMSFHNIRHLPVVDAENRLKGIFTYSDLEKAYKPRQTEDGWYFDKQELDRLILAHFITKDPLSLSPNDTLKKAAAIMAREKYGAIPIVEGPEKILVGIISYIDILKEIAKQL